MTSWKKRRVNKRSAPPSEEAAELGNGPQDDQDRAGHGETDQAGEAPGVKVVDRRWWARDVTESGEAARSDKPTYIEELETQLADKDKLLTDYTARYKAAANEFEETRVRLRKEVTKDVEREKRRVIASFLEIIDNLDRAIDASRGTSDDNPGVVKLLTGVEMVRQQFLLTLSGYGVAPIDAGGEPFDPNLHDAISVTPVTDPAHEGVVVDVVKPGYQLGDDVLRPASVTVGKLAPAPE
jgi:molecular chaperone GrpE